VTEKKRKVVFKDGDRQKVVHGYVSDLDQDLIKVSSFDGDIYIGKKSIIFIRDA